MARRSLSEAEKMQKVPGIIFIDGPAGRRAHVAGTGLGVFEVINVYRTCGEDRAATAEALDTLTPSELQAAFDYYEAFPQEIDAWLEEAAKITPEYLRAHFPQPKLAHRGTGAR